jgi:DNA-binding NtrC family response regulator
MTGNQNEIEIGNKVINVLLIEDNPDHVDIIWNALTEIEDLFLNLEYVDRLEKGLKRLDKGGVDVVLLNLRLPDCTTANPFFKVKNRVPDMPVIVLSNLKNDKVAIDAVLAGAISYFVKEQIDRDLLIHTIYHVLKQKQKKKTLVNQ